MVSSRERFLLNILSWIVAVVALSFLSAATLEKRAGLRGKINQLERQIPQFSAHAAGEVQLRARRQRLQAELEAERNHYYQAGQIDPYRFGILIRDLLVGSRLQIKRYQTLEVGKQILLEFSLEGSVLDLMKFLEAVSKSGKHWSMPFLSINARGDTGVVDAVFRIGYETLEPLGS